MSLESEYSKWWRKLPKADKELLKSTGFDYKNFKDDGVPIAHRYFGGETDKLDGYEDQPFSLANNSGYCPASLSNGYDINFQQFVKWTSDRNKNEDEVLKRFFSFDDVLEILNRVISILDDSNDKSVKLHATCIKIALGMPEQPNMTKLAREHNLTRAAVSLRVKTIQKNLGLSPSMYMKSEYACSKLSKARRKKL
jgi:hypothetical protein